MTKSGNADPHKARETGKSASLRLADLTRASGGGARCARRDHLTCMATDIPQALQSLTNGYRRTYGATRSVQQCIETASRCYRHACAWKHTGSCAELRTDAVINPVDKHVRSSLGT